MVFIGIGATYIGYPLLDAIAAILVALMIAKIGLDLSKKGVQELVDTALEPEVIKNIKQAIFDIDDVRHLHMLRTRRMGHNALVDVHIQVSPKLSVSEGHHIAERVEITLKEKFTDINDVIVHIDPEDDEKMSGCKDLPLRSEILSTLSQEWAKHETLKNINDVTLHYLNSRIDIEACLPLSKLNSIEDANTLKQEFNKTCTVMDCIGKCQLRFH